MRAYWDQLAKEGDRAFIAFRIYRDMDPHKRSLRAASFEYFTKKEALDPSTPLNRVVTASRYRQFQKWSSDNSWVKRTRARDAYLDKMVQVEHERAIKDMRARQANQCKVAAQLLTLPAAALGKRVKKALEDLQDPEKISTIDLLELLAQTTRTMVSAHAAERKARGVSDLLETEDVRQIEYVEVEQVRSKSMDNESTELVARLIQRRFSMARPQLGDVV